MENENVIQEVASPVSRTLILICEKCGENIPTDSGRNPAQELKSQLKTKIMFGGDKGRVRAVLTGCLNLCPKDGLAVGFCSADPSAKSRFFTLQGHLDSAMDVIW